MIVTTSYRPTTKQLNFANHMAKQSNLTFIPRNKQTLAHMHNHYQCDIMVVDENRVQLHSHNKAPIYYHPNSAMFRIKRLRYGQIDPLIEVCQLQPDDNVLDATFGLGADSLVFASQLTHGKVVATESNPHLAMLMYYGMQYHPYRELDTMIEKITLYHQDHYQFLKQCPDNSFDIVFLDPMFDTTISESSTIQMVRHLTNDTLLTQAVIDEALRVTKRAVVLRNHFRSQSCRFNHCYQCVRKNTKFHYWRITKSI